MHLSALLTRWPLVRLIALALLASLLPTLCTNPSIYADSLGATYVGIALAGPVWSTAHCGLRLLFVALAGGVHASGAGDLVWDFLGWGVNWAVGGVLLEWAVGLDYVEFRCDRDGGFDAVACTAARRVEGFEHAGGGLIVVVGSVFASVMVVVCCRLLTG